LLMFLFCTKNGYGRLLKMRSMMQQRHVFRTKLGVFGLGWNAAGLCRLVLPEPDEDAARARLDGFADGEASGWVAELAAAIVRYGDGEGADFGGVPVDFGSADAFDIAIWQAARGLAHGEVTTYGALAARAGHEGKARAVGAALGRNPVPLVVPCHRILAAGGRLGGFSAPGGNATKARLLVHERADTAPSLPGQQAFTF
jgi:methylated-DNA-[protein]-cysteine S-methyltransferase